MSRLLKAIIVLGLILALLFAFRSQIAPFFFKPTSLEVSELGVKEETITEPVQVVAEDLSIPWEIVFLPDNTMLVTERPGRLVRIYPNDKQVIEVGGVIHTGEGGLMGMALHPNYEQNNWLYLYLTSQADGGLINRIERYEFSLEDNQLSQREVILDNIPGAIYHDGGRIEFGPDGYLYATTGDAGDRPSAQDANSLAGKILRMNDDGSVPTGNPFQDLVYSLGHRNPQGLAWDNLDQLWITEHGPSGAETGHDEINLVKQGLNYGWPNFRGEQSDDQTQPAKLSSGRTETWAPAGAAIIENKMYFAGLRGESLYEFNLITESLTAHFHQDFGRLRAVVLGPDGWLYVTTSNTDGRGQAAETDDKIIKINPAALN